MMSDDSGNDIAFKDNQETDQYCIKYKLLLEECAKVQRANETLVFRIQEVNKITKRRHKEVQFFRQRLQNIHGEDWSVIPPEILSDEEAEDVKPNLNNTQIMIKKEIKQEKPSDELLPNNKDKNDKAINKTENNKPKPKRPPRRKIPKSEKDPNAPKRPSNPFFQFCQEQRQILMEQITADLKPGEIEPTKQELTRQLAIKWNSLSTTDKKIYVDRYERSKEKYNAEMEDYKRNK